MPKSKVWKRQEELEKERQAEEQARQAEEARARKREAKAPKQEQPKEEKRSQLYGTPKTENPNQPSTVDRRVKSGGTQPGGNPYTPVDALVESATPRPKPYLEKNPQPTPQPEEKQPVVKPLSYSPYAGTSDQIRGYTDSGSGNKPEEKKEEQPKQPEQPQPTSPYTGFMGEEDEDEGGVEEQPAQDYFPGTEMPMPEKTEAQKQQEQKEQLKQEREALAEQYNDLKYRFMNGKIWAGEGEPPETGIWYTPEEAQQFEAMETQIRDYDEKIAALQADVNAGEALGTNIMAGLESAGYGLTQALDWLGGENSLPWAMATEVGTLFGVDLTGKNPVTKLKEKGAEEVEYWKQRGAEATEGNDTWEAVGQHAQSISQSAPFIILNLMTMGGAGGAAASTEGLEYISSLFNSSGMQGVSTMAAQGVKALASNPSAQYSFATTFGNSYDEALKDGATPAEATVYAVLNGTYNAMIEVGGADEALGGMQALPAEVQQAIANGDKNFVINYAKSILGEVNEEEWQGFLERGLKSIYQDVALYSDEDPNAIINPQVILDTAKNTFIDTSIMSGGQMAAQYGLNALANAGQKQTQEQAQAPEVEALAQAATPAPGIKPGMQVGQESDTGTGGGPSVAEILAQQAQGQAQAAPIKQAPGMEVRPETDTGTGGPMPSNPLADTVIEAQDAAEAQEGAPVPPTAPEAGTEPVNEFNSPQELREQADEELGKAKALEQQKEELGENAPPELDTAIAEANQNAEELIQQAEEIEQQAEEQAIPPAPEAPEFSPEATENTAPDNQQALAGLNAPTDGIMPETGEAGQPAPQTSVEARGPEKERGFWENVRASKSTNQGLAKSMGEHLETYRQLVSEDVLNAAQGIWEQGPEHAKSWLYGAIAAAKSSNSKLPFEAIPLTRMVANQMEADGDVAGAERLLADVSAEMTDYGRLGNLGKLLRQDIKTPAGKLYAMRKTVEKINEDIQSKKPSKRARESGERASSAKEAYETAKAQTLEQMSKGKSMDELAGTWLRRLGVKFRELATQDNATRESVKENLASFIASDYAESPQSAEQIAEAICAEYERQLNEAIDKELAYRFGKKTRSTRETSFEQQLHEAMNLDAFNSEYAEQAIEKLFGVENQGVTIPQELIDKYNEQTTDEGRDEVITEMQKAIAQQMPANWLEKLNALRYTAMLGNFKTQVKNHAGNILSTLDYIAKNRIAAAIELMQYAVSGGAYERTKSFWAGKDLYKEAAADYKNVEADVLGEGKYSDWKKKTAKEIDQYRTILKFNGKWGTDEAKTAVGRSLPVKGVRKAGDFAMASLELWRKGTDKAMSEWSDAIYGKINYAEALGGWLAAHNIKHISDASPETLAKAREYATKQASEAIFRDRNIVSDAAASLGRGKTDNVIIKGLQAGISGVMPFRRTPANVGVRSWEFSPLGILNTFYKAYQEAEGTGNVTSADVIDQAAKALTGTGMMALGVVLKRAGLLRGKNKDDKEEQFEKNRGQQDYSLVLPNGKSVTMEWASPNAIPLFMGVRLDEAFSDGDFSLGDAIQLLNSINDPMLEMSMLQGLNNYMEALQTTNNNKGDAISEAIELAFADLIAQAVPSFLKQAERASEKYRQTTYVDPDSPLPASIQKVVGKMSQGIPGWDYHQQDYIDLWGRKQENDRSIGGQLETFATPWYTSEDRSTPVDDELQRLYGEDYAKVLPEYASRSTKVDNERITPDEFETFATERGQTALQLIQDFIESPEYQDLEDEDRATIIKNLYAFADKHAKTSVMRQRGDEEGYYGKDPVSVLLEAGNSVAEAGKIIRDLDEDYSGGVEQSEIYSYMRNNPEAEATMRALWEAAGYSKDFDKYVGTQSSKPENALVDAGLDAEKAAEMAEAMNVDGKNSITQDDIWAYYSEHPDEEEYIKAVWDSKTRSKTWEEFVKSRSKK